MKDCCLILGFFDGIHLGHSFVIQNALKLANENNLQTILITFKNSPSSYFNKNTEYILPREKSIKKIYKLGVNEVIELEFSNFVNLSAGDFIKYIKQEFSPKYIVTGFNYTFGSNKSGTIETIKEFAKKYNFNYICTPAKIVDNQIISSTLIKQLLKKGDIETANLYLNSNFSIKGIVKEGNKIGRTIGFPTANIDYPKNIVKLPYGVYCVKYENKKAIMNWGIKPTINNNSQEVAEVHIIDFNENLYNKEIEIEILHKIREEKKFNSLEELKQQIQKDKEECLKL